MEAMRPAVQNLIALGPMPGEANADADVVSRFQEVVEALPERATDDEAVALLDVFPADDDSLFGLAWAVLHLIETAPGWPLMDALDGRSWWVSFLRQRAGRGNA